MIDAMNEAIQAPMDSAGRIVVPKAVRERAGVHGGTVFDIVVRDDAVIELRPAPRIVRIEQRDGLPVAVPDAPSEPLSAETVEATLRQLRDRRAE